MRKILVIEDEKPIRDTLQDILEFNGYRVTCSANGQEGLISAQANQPDLVICDVMMPKLNGWQTVEAFRENSELRCVPFVFLSALSSMPDLRKGMNLGADDYLTKPFEPTELLSIVAGQLTMAETRNEYQIRQGDKRVKDAIREVEMKVEEKNKAFFDSLERAKAVQQVILPKVQDMKKLIPEYFTFYSPKDSVSGDFYWVKNAGGITLVAVADCTGHGVPAALLTIACYHSLNAAVERFGLRSPSEILTKVNDLVLEFIGDTGEDCAGDGMDIALCAIDHDYNLIRYAGAKRPLYTITENLNTFRVDEHCLKSFPGEQDKTLYEIKGSIYSMGTSMDSFEIKEQVFEYQEGDVIYLSSDGFVDQFGGDCDRKFNSNKLRNLLLSIQDETMVEQGQLLAQAFESWKGDGEQTDDVTLLGIKL